MSSTKLRRAAKNTLSVGLAVTTSLWMTGSAFMVAVPVAYASNQSVVEDVTGSNPRIAKNGESERVMLGINLIRTDNTDVVQLGFLEVQIGSSDGADAEAATANVEEVRVYDDSTLLGTNGVFDESDGMLHSVVRTEAGNSTTMTTQVVDSASQISDGATAGNTAPTTAVCVLDAAAANFAVGDAVQIVDGPTTFNRVLTAVTAIAGAGVGSACVQTGGGTNTHTLLVVDTAMAGRAAADGDTIIDLANYPAGITGVNLTDATGIANSDSVKLGTGLTAEVRAANALVGTVLSFPATTYVHANLEDVREVNNIAAGTVDEFDAFAAGAVAVQLGDTAGGDIMTGAYDIPKTDASDESGNDVFVVFVTDGGADAQTVTAQIWNGDIGYYNVTNTADTTVSIGSAPGTTDGTTVDVEFGADGDAPSITKVETYDNDKDGAVDRVKVYFSESMAADEMGTLNFVDALGGDTSEINALGSNDDDIDLNATGTWKTTTILNDTLQIDFVGDIDNPDDGETAGEYNNAAQSTGDTWSVVYDEDGGADVLKDATGENLLDTTISTTDMARPEMVSAELKDNDGNDKVDQLEVTWSESLSSSSDAAGYKLTNTTENPDKDYTFGAVTSFKKGDGADANSNDTMVIAVTEFKNDANDAFNLDYTASATVTDEAGNEGNSETNMGAPVDIAPRIEKVEYRDANSNGKLDSVLVTFTRNVDVVANSDGDFAVSGYTITGPAGASADVGAMTYTFGEKTFDTDETPQLTYNRVGDGKVCLAGGGADTNCAGANETPLENVVAGDVVEEDDAPPVLRSATMYESDNDSIWETGETFQLLFSENVDAAQIATGWNVSNADGDTAWTDWQFQTAVDAALADNQIPDSGTVSVAGRVATITASENATVAIGADEIDFVANEVKDMAGNSALVLAGGFIDLPLMLNPTAPAVSRIETRDLDGDGLVDGLEVEFGGMIAASSISMAEWAAARGANAFTTENVTPDLTITSVATVSGGDDTRVLVKFNESNEGTDATPQVKYVGVATLQDLAGNDIDDFNQYAGDDTLFEQTPTSMSVDGADPVVVLKRLRDRNLNGQYDQVVLVFSEEMNNGLLSTDGWDVSGESLAGTGAWFSNDGSYDAYTFGTGPWNIFKADILEGGPPTALPGVAYASTGAFADANGLVLGDVLSGGEESPEITTFVAPPPPSGTPADGELFQLTGGDGSVWIAKVVGTKKFRRHVLWGDFDVIYPHLAPMWPVAGVDQATYDMYGLSAWIRVAGTAPVYEVNDDMTAHWLTCDDDPVDGQDCANEWTAAGGDPDGIFDINGVGGEWDRLTQTNDVVLPDQVD